MQNILLTANGVLKLGTITVGQGMVGQYVLIILQQTSVWLEHTVFDPSHLV